MRVELKLSLISYRKIRNGSVLVEGKGSGTNANNVACSDKLKGKTLSWASSLCRHCPIFVL